MAIAYRIRCPKCGHVQNTHNSTVCAKCGTPNNIQKDGCIQIYRMGNFFGGGAGLGIYLNGIPYGHIGNRESLRIPLDAGTYTLHMAQGVARKCNDPVIEITPSSNALHCYKVHVRVGAWVNSFVIEPAKFDDMPK